MHETEKFVFEKPEDCYIDFVPPHKRTKDQIRQEIAGLLGLMDKTDCPQAKANFQATIDYLEKCQK